MTGHDMLLRHITYQEIDKTELRSLLNLYGISYEAWGLGGTKHVDDLVAEIADGEVSLEDRDGVLIRKVDGVAIDVFADIDGARYRLREDRQVFARDGTVKRRNLSTSLGEKIKRGETYAQAMVRALREELDITVQEVDVTIGESTRQTVASKAYPGIVSDRGLTMGAVMIPHDQVRPEGYIEHQPQKDNYFVWELLS